MSSEIANIPGSMQMEHKEGNAPAEGEAKPQATPADSDSHSKPPNAEDGSQIAQQMHETITHRNGSTSAKVEGKQAESFSKPNTNDTELQRRKAALLQQVEDALARAEVQPPSAAGKLVMPAAAESEQRSHDVEPAAQIQGAPTSAEVQATSATGKGQAPATAEIEHPSHELKPVSAQQPVQATLAEPLSPRKLKLQPGDFYITLPKPSSAESDAAAADSDQHADSGREVAGEASARQNGHIGQLSDALPAISDTAQAADVIGSGNSQEQDRLLMGSSLAAVEPSEGHPDSAAASAGASMAPVIAAASVPEASQMAGASHGTSSESTAEPWRHSRSATLSALLEPYPDNACSPGNRYAAAAARKEEAQELALEQAILEMHWRHAEEGMPSDEAATEEPTSAPLETEGTPADVSCQHGIAAAATQQIGLQSATAQGNAAWGGSTAAAPWSDYAAGTKTVGEVTGNAGAASRQHSVAELAAQAKAWSDWAAWQAQSGSQDPNHAILSANTDQPESVAGQSAATGAAGNTSEQYATAEIDAQAKAWAEWAFVQAQSAAQTSAQSAGQSYAYPAADTQQGSAQGTHAAQLADPEMVSVPLSLYKRYQELEWAEWHRQYERWQKQYDSWYTCYEHWYSSYLTWYNQHGGSAT